MTEKTSNILMCGVGGQGIITTSNMLSRAAMNAGRDVKKSEIHGMSQRGGSVFSHVRFGAKIHSPVISCGQADILVSLEEMETLRWMDYPRADSRIFILRNRILPFGVEKYPEGIEDELNKCFSHIAFLEPDELKNKTGSAKTLNVAVLGAVSNYLDIAEECWKEAICALAPNGTADMNWAAFECGKSEDMRV
jgi:indolepyruvate ferredoxin oxidoreductase beta subunit